MTEAKREAIARLRFNADFQRGYGSDTFPMRRDDADTLLLALSEQPQVSDAFEVANQLGSYVGPDTEPKLAAFLLEQSEAAAAMGYELERLRAPASEPQALSEERAGEIFDQAMRDARQDVGVWIREPAIRAMIRFATET